MNCAFCNAETITRVLDYQCNNRIIGNIVVPRIDVDQCPRCGELILSEKAEIAISHFLEARVKEAISSLPAEDLISAGQAAAILGVTKQAFSKNPKIKNGFVYFVYVGTKKFYFRTSVTLYKTTGDGRFPITKWKSSMDSARITDFDATKYFWQQISSSNDPMEDGLYVWNTSVQEIAW